MISIVKPDSKNVEAYGHKTINLPSRYILSENGVIFCTKTQIPVRDIRNHVGRTSSGLLKKTSSVHFVKNFIRHGLLSEIEITRPEFLSHRQDLISLITSSVEGSMTYRFCSMLHARIGSKHHEAISLKNLPEGHPLKRAIQAKKQELTLKSRRMLLERPNSAGDESLFAKASELVGAIDTDAWINLTIRSSQEKDSSLINSLVILVATWTKRMEMAELVALVFMELVQYAEQAQFLNLASHDKAARKNPLDGTAMLANENFRLRLAEKAERNQENMVFQINFSEPTTLQNDHYSLRISVRNRGLVGYQSRSGFLDAMRQIRTESFEDFLKRSATEPEGNLLGLAYLSTLADRCKKSNINMDSSMSRDERKDETISSMLLTL